MKEPLQIPITDREVLSATKFNPAAPNGSVVLINSAIGVKQRYYEDFAIYLAKNGFVVYTYDYRGIGLSRPKNLRNLTVSLKDWGAVDYHSMLGRLLSSHRAAKIIVIGHSVGGQFIGLSPLTAKVHSIVMVASQTPYIKRYPGLVQQVKLHFFWYVLIPVLTPVFGYFPGKKLRLFEDLPRRVASQWARLARSRSYLFKEFPEEREKFIGLSRPALMINFTDDTYAPPPAVDDLIEFYPKVDWHRWQLTPTALGLRSIGHFTFFKKKMEPVLWRDVLDWINLDVVGKKMKNVAALR